MKTTTSQFAGIHEEFVKVIQGASSLYRVGSDRINNAEHYCRKHASALLDFDTGELHPHTVTMYRNMARRFAKETNPKTAENSHTPEATQPPSLL